MTVLDDGDAGEISFVESEVDVDEDAGALEVALVRSAGSGRVTARVLGAGAPVHAVFEDGVLSATAVITLVDDDVVELDERMSLNLADPDGGATVSGAGLVVHVRDDYDGGIFSFGVAEVEAEEGDDVVPIQRAGSSGAAVATLTLIDRRRESCLQTGGWSNFPTASMRHLLFSPLPMTWFSRSHALCGSA